MLEGSLDEVGCESVVDLLRIKAKEMDSIFVVSHHPGIQDRFDDVINIKKRDGISSIK